MKQTILIVVTALLVASCRNLLPQSRHLQQRAAPARQSTGDARRSFSHSRHHRVFEQAQVTCIDCHRFDVLIEAGEQDLARSISAHALYPGGAACHHCHTDERARVVEAPRECTTCHANLAPLRPADHEVAWMKVHASMAHADAARCSTCHRQAECIDCHQRRDSIRTRVHDRNFRFFHSVAVRANPMQCGSCHREDFCMRCHERGGIEGGD